MRAVSSSTSVSSALTLPTSHARNVRLSTPASLVTLYLTTSGNSKLRPKFEGELRGGARVVSHDFPIQEWTTLKGGSPGHYALGSHRIYLYKVPDAYEQERANLRSNKEEGRWRRIRSIFLRS